MRKNNMTNYYGIGTWWTGDNKHYYNEFIKDKNACISTDLDKPTKREIENRREFRRIFLSIKKDDIIYLKGFGINNQIFRIRAIGTVLSKPRPSENADYIHCVDVKYHPNHDFDGLKDFDIFNDGIKRNTRVYQETNPEVIRFIDSILEKKD